ncbi:FG-GAP-like repeat-containing protein [Gaetbulibacter jejuensis]|uniref:Fibronectin type-III domain-containing protein n=1 Tax=Gaetbulibacter jejuensis TaxID=584607 RepID=A0ABN1JDT6_9FLAO
MKKITLVLFLISSCLSAQVLNQSANWPNTNWTLSGTYDSNPLIFVENPTVDSSTFSFDEDEAGDNSINNIAAVSPVINLTNAYNAGETWILVDANYVISIYQDESLSLEYWDDDASSWISWGTPITSNSSGAPNSNFCAGPPEALNAGHLNISAFTANQLANFQYRIHYNDNSSWGWGFCLTSPTIYSQMPPACPNITNLSVSNVSYDSADIFWQAGDVESSWEIAIQLAGTGVPTGSGESTTYNNPYEASSLLDNTTYEVYVRGNCGGGDYSNWIGPVNFTTPVLSRVNFTQDPIDVASGYDLTVVDMNNDFLDDIVSVSNTNVNIHYQLSTGGFNEANLPTPEADFMPGWSMAAADFDANGYTDLVYGNTFGVTFMKANDTGTAFTEISGPEDVFSQRTNFVDINNDGHLDAFVCHDVAPNVFYINDGNGNLTFNQGGLGDYSSGGNYGSIWIDYDNDRDIDMFIAKCGGEVARRTNQMLTNNGDGTFTENATALGLDDPMQTWSSTWGDYDNDGDMDVFVGASSGSHKLMRNNGNGTFTDVTSGAGVSTAPTGHENVSYDFDNDGFLDIACNGTIMYGKGDLTFEDIDNAQLSYANGSFGDLNNDGFIDAYYNETIYWNNTTPNNWITINTVGTVSNIHGIGARVEIHTDSGTQIRDVRSGEGFKYMSTLNTHFGLGSQTSINNITIYWPSGIIDIVENPTINTSVVVVEGETLGLDDTLTDNLIIYPNPTKDFLNISLPADNLESAIYTIFDISGKRVSNAKLDGSIIDVSYLSSGNYVLRIISGNSIKTQKFIKQ